ncbi:MAG: hypothetical protein Q8O38_09470, partial [Sulfurimicrobium sp.]|nr:hypothetical protein [Sulfurimicrobium sp.]
MYYYPGKRLIYIRAFNKAAKLRFYDLFLDRQLALPGFDEMQSQQIGGEARTARSVARTERTGTADSALDLDFFGLPEQPL